MYTNRKLGELALSLVAFSGLSVFTCAMSHVFARPVIQDYISGPAAVMPGSRVSFYATGDVSQHVKFNWKCSGGTIVSAYNNNCSIASWKAPDRRGMYRITARQPGAKIGAYLVIVQ